MLFQSSRKLQIYFIKKFTAKLSLSNEITTVNITVLLIFIYKHFFRYVDQLISVDFFIHQIVIINPYLRGVRLN